MANVSDNMARVSFRNRRYSSSRILDAKYVPEKSSNVKMSGIIAIASSGGRAVSVSMRSCGMVVSAEKVANPIVALRAIKIDAVRMGIPISLAAARMERRKAGRTITETIVSLSSTPLLLSCLRIWLVEVEAKQNSTAQLETWPKATRIGSSPRTKVRF